MSVPTSERVTVSAPWPRVAELSGREFVGSWFSPAAQRNADFDVATYVSDNQHPMSTGQFPDGLIEGFYQLALLDHLVNEVVYVDDSRWSGWNYGLDRVRFTSPLSTADRFRVKGVIREVHGRDDGYLVVIECRYDVAGRDKPSMVATWRVLWTLDE